MKGAPLLVGTAAAVILAVCAWALSGTPPRPTLLPVPRSTTTIVGSTTSTVPAPTTTSTTVAPPPPAPPAPPPVPATYVVQPGDTLASIGAAHGIDWWALCYNNRLADCNLIYPGQVLKLDGTPPPSGPPHSQTTAPPQSQPAPAAHPSPPAPAPPPPGSGFGCDAAIAYLQAHAAPGYTFECAPHDALGHWGYTCVNVAGVCPGAKTIHIACPDPTVYRNEAANSQPPIMQRDPYGEDAVAVSDATCNALA